MKGKRKRNERGGIVVTVLKAFQIHCCFLMPSHENVNIFGGILKEQHKITQAIIKKTL